MEKLTGKHVKRINLGEKIAKERRRSEEFREAYDSAVQMRQVAKSLAKLRESRGISQKDLALKLNTSQQAISRMERPDYQGHTLRMIAKYITALGGKFELRVQNQTL